MGGLRKEECIKRPLLQKMKEKRGGGMDVDWTERALLRLHGRYRCWQKTASRTMGQSRHTMMMCVTLLFKWDYDKKIMVQ